MNRYVWLIVFIIILPLALWFTHLPQDKKTAGFQVPSLHEQPTDTQVVGGALPIHQWTTTNGTEVTFVPTEKLPMVDIYITFDAGSAHDGDLWGLASIVGNLLEEGTERMNATQIAQAFENVGAEFNTNVTRDRFIISLRSLTLPSSLNPVIELLTDILTMPSYPENSVEQIKNQILIELKKNLQEPSTLAAQALYQAMYPNHPYGHLTIGSMDTVSKITRQDMIAFHKKYFVAKNAKVTIVGGLPRDTARNISNRLFNKLPQGEKADALPKLPDPKAMLAIKIPFTSSQTYVLMGQSFDFTEPEYYSILVGNYILGEGPLVARLFKEIRNKRGLVYNVGSNVKRMLEGGLFVARLQTKTSQTSEALSELNTILKDFRANGPTEQELTDAKKGLIGAFPLNISNNTRIADAISEITFYNLPLDYLNQYVNAIQNVTKESIQKAFTTRLDPDKMALVLVGENLP